MGSDNRERMMEDRENARRRQMKYITDTLQEMLTIIKDKDTEYSEQLGLNLDEFKLKQIQYEVISILKRLS